MTYVQMPRKDRYAPEGMRRCPECGGLVRKGQGNRCPRCKAANAQDALKNLDGRPVRVTRADGTVETVNAALPLWRNQSKFNRMSLGAQGTCEKCGRQFTLSARNQKVCSACRADEKRRARKPARREAVCVVCGKRFALKRSHAKYCSDSCSAKARAERDSAKRKQKNPIVEKTCPICGKRFETSSSVQAYCSVECRLENQRRSNRERYAGRRKFEGGTARCPTCGKEFEMRRSGHKFCSKQCSNRYRGDAPEIECKVCGKMFVPSPKHRKLCSTECAMESTRRKIEEYRKREKERKERNGD